MALVPATNHTEITDRINHLFLHGKSSDIEIKRLDRAVADLKKVDPTATFSLAMPLRVLQGDEAKFRETARVAMSTFGHEYVVHVNLRVSLHNMGYFNEAVEIAIQAARRFPGNIDAVRSALHGCIYVGRYQDAQQIAQALAAMSPEEPSLHIPGGFLAIAGKFQMEDASMNQMISLAEHVLREYRGGQFTGRALMLEPILLNEDADAESVYTVIRIPVFSDEEIELVVDVNRELCDRLADQSMDTTHFTIAYEAAYPEEGR